MGERSACDAAIPLLEAVSKPRCGAGYGLGGRIKSPEIDGCFSGLNLPPALILGPMKILSPLPAYQFRRSGLKVHSMRLIKSEAACKLFCAWSL
jgi:hypothetical protein